MASRFISRLRQIRAVGEVEQRSNPPMRRMSLSIIGVPLRCAVARADLSRGGQSCGHSTPAPARGRGGLRADGVESPPLRVAHAALTLRPRFLRVVAAASPDGSVDAVTERPVSTTLEGSPGSTVQQSDTSHEHGPSATAAAASRALDAMRPPSVDWSKYGESEATSTSGRVRSEVPYPTHDGLNHDYPRCSATLRCRKEDCAPADSAGGHRSGELYASSRQLEGPHKSPERVAHFSAGGA